MKRTIATISTLALAALGSPFFAGNLQAQSAESLVNKLVQKGILTDQEGKELMTQSTTNQMSASKWKLNNAIKNIELFGDVRLRYEYRAAENVPGSGVSGDSFKRERFRYALRAGIRGDLYDDWYYGIRLETSANPRSTRSTSST